MNFVCIRNFFIFFSTGIRSALYKPIDIGKIHNHFVYEKFKAILNKDKVGRGTVEYQTRLKFFIYYDKAAHFV